MKRLALIVALALSGTDAHAQQPHRYGLIGEMKAVPGKRAELAAILLGDIGAMPGCLSYVVSEDAKDPDTLWISEVWDSKASHDASLALPAVRAAITKGRPLIAGFGRSIETSPLGDAVSVRR